MKTLTQKHYFEPQKVIHSDEYFSDFHLGIYTFCFIQIIAVGKNEFNKLFYLVAKFKMYPNPAYT